MRVMPFLTVPPDLVEVSEPILVMSGKEFSPSDQVDGWDYQTPVTVSGHLRTIPEKVREHCGISSSDPSAVQVLMRVDCQETGNRWIDCRSFSCQEGIDLQVEIPAGTAAGSLGVSYELVLNRENPAQRGRRVATRCGSRLYQHPRTYRFQLEGDAEEFPMDAFPFRGGEFPSESAWVLDFNGDDLSAPYLASVRLYLNTGHPDYEEFVTRSALITRDVLLQMIFAVAVNGYDGSAGSRYEDGSVGAVLSALTYDNFQCISLLEAVELAKSEPTRLFALSQVPGFLGAYQ